MKPGSVTAHIAYLTGPLAPFDYSIRVSLTYNHEFAWFF